MGLLIIVFAVLGFAFAILQAAWTVSLAAVVLVISGFQSIFSTKGIVILTTGVALWTVGATWSASHTTVYAVADEVWCKTQPLRGFVTDVILQAIAPISEGSICFWNLYWHWMAEIRNEAIAIGLECPTPVIQVFVELLSMVGSAANEAINVLFHPLSYNVDLTNFWDHWKGVVDGFVGYMECYCFDILPLVELLTDTIKLNKIKCVLEYSINSGLALFRVPINVIFSNFPSLSVEFPVFTTLFDQLCGLLGCIGDLLDDFVRLMIARALGLSITSVNNPSIGCTISRFLCVLLRVVQLILDLLLLLLKLAISVVDFGQFIENGLDFNPLLDSLVELGQCVYDLFANINPCAGQSAQNVILFIVESINLLLAIIRDINDISTALTNWNNALQAVVGDTQYGDLGENYLGLFVHDNDDVHSFNWYCDMDGSKTIGNYNVTIQSVVYTGSELSFPCEPGYVSPDTPCKLPGTNYTSHCLRRRARAQTSFTCFVASILGNGICSRAIADFTTSIVDLFLLIPDFMTELINGSIAATPGICGPFGTEPDRDATITFIELLIDLALGRVLSVLDYFGHVIECIPVLTPLGKVICELAYGIFLVASIVARLLAVIIAFIVQGIIMVIELVSGSTLFPSCTESQLLAWLNIFFEELLATVFDIVAGFIDLILFNWFPGVINLDPGLLFSNGGHPSFTECIEFFGDCICVLVQSLLEEVFGWGPTCTISWKRKRDVMPEGGVTGEMSLSDHDAYRRVQNHPVWNMVQDITYQKFDPSLDCGHVLNSLSGQKMANATESQKLQVYRCMQLLVRGYKLAHVAPGVNPDFFFNPHRVKNTTLNVISTIPHAFYFWMTKGDKPIEEHMAHIDDPVTISLWKSLFSSIDNVNQRLKYNQTEESLKKRFNARSTEGNQVRTNPFHSQLELAVEAARLAASLPYELWKVMTRPKMQKAFSDAIDVIADEKAKRTILSTLFTVSGDVERINVDVAQANSTEQSEGNIKRLALVHALNGLSAMKMMVSGSSGYSAQASSGLVELSDFLNLFITGRVNKSYTDEPPLIPGFMCAGFDRTLRRLANKTEECGLLYNVSSFSTGPAIATTNYDPRTIFPFGIEYRPSHQQQTGQAVVFGDKSDSLTNVGISVVQYLNEQLLGGILGDIAQWPTTLANTVLENSVDDSGSGGHGVWWYLLFPLYCSREKLTCENGRGLVDGFIWTALYVVLVLIFVGYVLPAGIGSLFSMILIALIPTMFFGISIGYAPVCLPRIPICSVTQLNSFFIAINTSCIPWPDGVATGVCDGTCSAPRTFPDCRADVGILDGFDELLFIFEWKFSLYTGYLRDSIFYGYLKKIPYLGPTLEGPMNLMGDPPTDLQKFCFWTQITLLWQPIIIFTLLGEAGALALTSAIMVLGAAFNLLLSIFNIISAVYISIKLGAIQQNR
jgi:hypothetical protein